MKFYTYRVYHSWQIKHWNNAYESYRAYMEDLKTILPSNIIELADPNLLDDGLVRHVDFNRDTRVLKLLLRCGNLQVGYYDIEITYLGATITEKHNLTLAKIARTTKGSMGFDHDIHFHEFTVNKKGRITHRFLFNPGVQFAISCDSIIWKRTPREERNFSDSSDRYPNGPQTPTP